MHFFLVKYLPRYLPTHIITYSKYIQFFFFQAEAFQALFEPANAFKNPLISQTGKEYAEHNKGGHVDQYCTRN